METKKGSAMCVALPERGMLEWVITIRWMVEGNFERNGTIYIAIPVRSISSYSGEG